jgi:hypothetical protein
VACRPHVSCGLAVELLHPPHKETAEKREELNPLS